MAAVLVTGGSGTLGSLIVAQLAGAGHDVRVLSRRPGVGTHQGDLARGDGLADAIAGVDTVIHAASDTRRFGFRDVEQTRNLLAAASKVSHLLYVSIVGVDVIPYLYYGKKLQCERLVESSAVPHTILRATQFHELVAMVLRAVERLPVAPLPLDFKFQPVAAAEVAARIAQLVGSGPGGRAPDMGGPEVLELSQIAATWRARRGRPRRVSRLPLPGRSATGFRQGLNTCPEQATGHTRWADYVADLPA